jgi:hypothetical protein
MHQSQECEIAMVRQGRSSHKFQAANSLLATLSRTADNAL